MSTPIPSSSSPPAPTVSASSAVSSSIPAPAFVRLDGRTSTQIRPFEVENSLLNRADGSVRFSQGGTTVLCAVYGPLSAPISDQLAHPDRASLVLNFRSLVGSVTGNEIRNGEIIKTALESVIQLDRYPRTRITVAIQVLKDDGSLIAASLNAASLALLDSGVEMNSMIAAVKLLSTTTTTINMNGNEQKTILLLDPTTEEESDKESNSITFAFNSISPDLITSDCIGLFSESEYFQLAAIGRKACAHIQHFFRISLTKKLQQTMEI